MSPRAFLANAALGLNADISDLKADVASGSKSLLPWAPKGWPACLPAQKLAFSLAGKLTQAEI